MNAGTAYIVSKIDGVGPEGQTQVPQGVVTGINTALRISAKAVEISSYLGKTLRV